MLRFILKNSLLLINNPGLHLHFYLIMISTEENHVEMAEHANFQNYA